MDIRNPCLILEGKKYDDYSIVTPWDIVMKTSEIEIMPWIKILHYNYNISRIIIEQVFT